MANYSVCGIDCDKLKEWASSENPERIDNLRNL